MIAKTTAMRAQADMMAEAFGQIDIRKFSGMTIDQFLRASGDDIPVIVYRNSQSVDNAIR